MAHVRIEKVEPNLARSNFKARALKLKTEPLNSRQLRK